MRYDEAPADTDRARFRELITKRVASWPVAYLIGSRGFYLLDFDVGPAVLIPRPDTETLVLEAVDRLKPLDAPAVLDLGTGSGCIAISLAHQKKDARVTAVDVSPDALSVARHNAEKHNVSGRVTFEGGAPPDLTKARFTATLQMAPSAASVVLPSPQPAQVAADGSFRIGTFQGVPNLDWAVAELPSHNGVRSNFASYWVNGVSSKSTGPKRDAAMKFMKHLTSDAAMQLWLKTTGELPAKPSVSSPFTSSRRALSKAAVGMPSAER